MNILNQTSTWQYAVFTIRNEPQWERLVIPYPNEKALRDLIAAPSIVTLGYNSREEALLNIDRRVSTTALSWQASKARIVDLGAALLKEVRAANRWLVGKFECATAWKILRVLTKLRLLPRESDRSVLHRAISALSLLTGDRFPPLERATFVGPAQQGPEQFPHFRRKLVRSRIDES